MGRATQRRALGPDVVRAQPPEVEGLNPAINLDLPPPGAASGNRPVTVNSASMPATGPRGGEPVRRFGARFALLYVPLYALPFPLNLLPRVGSSIDEAVQAVWDQPVRWVGLHAFHLNVARVPGGSGDTIWNYVQVLCIVVLAGVGALAWSAAQRHWSTGRDRVQSPGRRERRLFEGVRVYAAFVLAAAMISYGASKVVLSQFPPPVLEQLLGRYGDGSRMSLLWTFIGSSMPYQIFCGAVELAAGLLLTFRRTRLLGALLAAAAMTNVVLLNFAYDVPVKLYSSHLLALAILVVLPDLGPLARFFVRGQRLGAPAHASGPLFTRAWRNRTIAVVRTLLVLAYCAGELHDSLQTRRLFASAPVPAVYGVWKVEEFAINGTPRPPLLTDTLRWWHLCFDHIPVTSIQTADQQTKLFLTTYDEPLGTIRLSDLQTGTPFAQIHYTRPRPDVLELTGTLNGQPVVATARRVDLATFKLNRPMHWVHENIRRAGR